jgi:hypothetical protein
MEQNQLIRMTDLKQLGLQLKGSAPPDSNKMVTKGELNTYFYIDPSNEPMASYPNNRLITLLSLGRSLLQKPSAPFYEYDVTRSGIPGASGGFFNYVAPDFSIQTILQNSYGYVGRFCMQEDSYRNNQYNLYSISQVGVCFPDFGDTYPQPLNPQYRSGYLNFTSVYGYEVHNIKLYKEETVNSCQGGLAAYDITGLVCTIRGAWDALFGTGLGGGTTNELKYSQSGLYNNSSLSLSQFQTGKYFITYDVVNIFGGYVVYQYLDTAQSPSFFLNN